MFFFFFNFDRQDNTGCHENNSSVLKQKNRQDLLELEAKLLVLRLLQLRDSHKTIIKSVRQDGVELPELPELREVKLSEISVNEILALSNKVNYNFTCRVPGHSKVFSKVNIEVNGSKYGIRCFDHTERPLINHSTRDKFQKLCQKANVSIEGLDNAVDFYWECRQAGIFNEDCIYTSPLNPFLEIKDDLRKLLTYIAFHAYDISKDVDDQSFEVEKLDGYIDYLNPCDETTWDVLDEEHFFDKIWSHLRFSFRADRGMPNHGLTMPENDSVARWTREWKNKKGESVFKGALHIRISKYETAINDTPFEELFLIQHREEIAKVKMNQGDKDEYLIKLFLVECRENKRAIPIGDHIQVVESVENSKHEVIGVPERVFDWNKINPGLLVFLCEKIHAGKAGSFYKADVFINGIGISVKSQRGSAPSIINHTSREKILRVMKSINSPIEPLDHIVNRYWCLRLNGGGEDVSGINSNNPFTVGENGETHLYYLKPLLNYFTFKGTGTRDSSAPASYVLSIGNPNDTSTWVYYTEDNFVDSVWEKLVFSIRAKGLPAVITEDIQPWVKEINGDKKGALSVRVKK